MNPIPGPYPLYQIFDSYNPKFQFYKFDIPEWKDVRDKEGKLLTSVTVFGSDEVEAFSKAEKFIKQWQK